MKLSLVFATIAAVATCNEDAAQHHHHHHRVGHRSNSFLGERHTVPGPGDMVNEMKEVQMEVEKQLQKDHAPEKVLAEEQALLSRATTAVEDASKSMEDAKPRPPQRLPGAGGKPAKHRLEGIPKEIETVENAVEKQLQKDHAPQSLQNEEKKLLMKAAASAEHAVEEVAGTVRHAPSRAARPHATKKHLSQRERIDQQALHQGMQQIGKDISQAKQMLQDTLRKEGAPADMIRKEQGLLDKAAAAGFDAMRSQDPRMLPSHRIKLKGTSASPGAINATERHAKNVASNPAELLRTYTTGMSKVIKSDQHLVKDTVAVEREVAEALQEVHASSKTQKEVGELLDRAAKVQREEIRLEKRSVEDAKKEEVASLVGDRTAATEKTSANTAAMFRAYEADLSKVMGKEKLLAKDAVVAEHEASKALKEMGVNAKTQTEVENLLGKVESIERENLGLERKSLASAESEGRARFSHEKQSSAAVAKSDESAQRSGVHVDEAASTKLNELESEHTVLRQENKALRQEHDKLEEANEEKIIAENKKLEEDNAQFREENAELKRRLEASS